MTFMRVTGRSGTPTPMHFTVLNLLRKEFTKLSKESITEDTPSKVVALQESLDHLMGQVSIPAAGTLKQVVSGYLETVAAFLSDKENAEAPSTHPLAEVLGVIQSDIDTLEDLPCTDDTLVSIVTEATSLRERLDALKKDPTASTLLSKIERLEQRLAIYCAKIQSAPTTLFYAPIARRASTRTTAYEPILPCCPGLTNAGANCWLNSLLQMVTHVPSLETAYRTFARWKMEKRTEEEQPWARVLLEQLELLKADQVAGSSISRADTQQLRLAFHHLFRNGLGESAFSDSPLRHEDLHEGLMKIMQGYEGVLREQQQFHPLPDCYRNTHTVRYYQPTGITSAADPAKIAKKEYSVIEPGNKSTITSPEFHIFLPLQGTTDRNIDALLLNYFRQTAMGNELARYLGTDGDLHQYALTQVKTHYATPPEEIVVCVGRFASFYDVHNPAAGVRTAKIDDSVPFKRILTLPREATLTRETVLMELDAFAVHRGGLNGGHYLSYKKIGNVWIECNDSHTAVKTGKEIDEILKTSYVHHYRRITPEAAAAYRLVETHAAHSYATIEVPAYQQLVMLALAQVNKRKAAIQALEEVCRALSEGSPVNMSSIPESIRTKFYGFAWIRDWIGRGTKSDNLDYGRNICEGDPSTLKRACVPLFSTQGHLAEQFLEWQKDLLQVDLAKELSHKIRAVLEAMHDPSLSHEELLSLYRSLPTPVQNALEGKVYFHQVTKKGKEVCHDPKYHGDYGRVVLDSDIRALYDVKDMIPSIESSEAVDLLLSLLNNPSASQDELLRAFYALAPKQQNEIRGFIYNAHVQKFGKERCHDTEKGPYGKVSIAEHPGILLEKRDESEESLIEQVLHETQLQAQKAENRIYQHRLQAYQALLQNEALTPEQLITAFEFLEVPSHLKDTLLLLVAEANGSSLVATGREKFRENPRCLNQIEDPLLARPPILEKGKSLMEQMIALLGR